MICFSLFSGRVGGGRLHHGSSYEELPLVKMSSVNTDSVQGRD